MIAHLTGQIKSKGTHSVIIDVNGVGYEVCVSLNTFYELPLENQTVSLFIHTYVREDQLVLFGFLKPQEKSIFQKLLKVSGVGPKVAMTLLSGLSPNELVESITSQNSGKLKGIPGVGQKTAEKIIIELKGKLKWEPPLASAHTNGDSKYQETLSALVNLGYNRAQTERALANIAWQSSMTLEEAIKRALKEISGK